MSSIEVTVAALQHMAADMQLPPLRKEQLVQQAIAAGRRVAPRDVMQEQPLTAALLQRCLEVLQRGAAQWRDRRDAALLSVGWSGMLRSAELVGIKWEQVPSVTVG